MPKAARNFSNARRPAAGASPAPAAATDSAPAPAFLPPMKPSRRMFLVGAGLVAIWLGTLLTLYFLTIYPNRAARRSPGAVPANAPATLPAGTVER